MESRIVSSALLGGSSRSPGSNSVQPPRARAGVTNMAPTSAPPAPAATATSIAVAPTAAKNVTPPPKRSSSAQRSQLPQPHPSSNASHPEMSVDKRIVDELLLICGVIGSTATTSTNDNDDNVDDNGKERGQDQERPQFIPVTDCLNWLQDLQRALRRDSDTYRPIGLLLGQWRVVSQKLLPLVVNCSYDSALVLTICKILVILTKPLAEGARRAGGLILDVKSGKVDDGVIREQIILRDNAIAQSNLLMEYKKIFVRHPSHHYAFKSNHASKSSKQTKAQKSVKQQPGLFSIFTSLLATPLSKTGSSRTTTDHHTIELVLHLFRNLLSISPLNNYGSSEKAREAMALHREMIVLMKEEMVLDVLMVIGQEVERRENEGYNLLLMEILHHLLRSQDPTDVALSARQNPSSTTVSIPTPNIKSKYKNGTRKTIITTSTRPTSSTFSACNSLRAQLQLERQRIQETASSRHSHFGGTLLLSKPGGRHSYVSASGYLSQQHCYPGTKGGASLNTTTTTASHTPMRRKNKKTSPFIGSGKSSSLHSRHGASLASSREVASPIVQRAKFALNEFCREFVRQCYGPVMKSLKNEFRRDSNRLEEGDRCIFFRIVWFFHQWWRFAVRSGDVDDVDDIGDGAGSAEGSSEDKGRKDNAERKTDAGEESGKGSAQNLIFTMDVFMFNLVFNSVDEFIEKKQPMELAQSVSLYAEMIHMLQAMYVSKDPTERMMALGLMDRIFYAPEPIDRLPKLLSRWTPGTYSREYLCDLVECTHVALKLLDANAERCKSALSDETDRKRPSDALERMNITASEFDKNAYFMRKFVSNQIVFMHIQLLSRYSVNAPHINRHIAAYFIRLCKFNINRGDGDMDGFDDALGKNVLATKTSTFEPMLYNIGMFTVMEKILNDASIRDNEDFSSLLMFASSFMKRFARAAEMNPMLFVEAMFKHNYPVHFCELVTNMYVDEELRMIALKDILLEDQRRYEEANANESGIDNEERYNDEEEEELEFNENADDDVGFISKDRRKSSRHEGLNERETKIGTPSRDEGRSNNESSQEEEEMEFEDKENGVSGEDKADNDDEDDARTTTPAPMIKYDGIVEPVTKSDADETQSGIEISGNGRKRIRKSQGVVEESEDEDFSSPAKNTRRRILDDDDDEDE
ncbi:hypothetical protein ACHAXS_008379 [Conticribra weissflogii]